MLFRKIKISLLALGLSMGASAQRVANAEYYWDTDPGAGNGTAMTAEDGAFDEALERIILNTSTLPGLGAHVLGIRVLDEDNNWGPAFRTTIVIEPTVASAPDIHVLQAEFFWDTDPGEGNGTTMLAFDGDFNDALEAIELQTSALPSDGVHVLHIRSRDVNDAWSTPFSVIVEVLGGVVTFPDIQVAAAEYYVNDDPGEGNGEPMLAVDGNFSAALEAIKGAGIPAPVTSGVNVLWMRAKDINDGWGPSFGIVVNIDTTIAITTAVNEPTSNEGVRLSPNPTTTDEGFVIQLDGRPENLHVLVLDAAGRVVLDRQFASTRRVQVALPSVAPGVYQVGIHRNGTIRWERLVLH